MHIYIYIHTYMHICIYIHIYKPEEDQLLPDDPPVLDDALRTRVPEDEEMAAVAFSAGGHGSDGESGQAAAVAGSGAPTARPANRGPEHFAALRLVYGRGPPAARLGPGG